MGKYASVLHRSEPEEDLRLSDQRSTSHFSGEPAGHRAYAELAAKLFDGVENPRVVAFASVQSGAGVTQTIRGLAVELARQRKTVVALDGSLQTFDLPGVPVLDPSRNRGGTHEGSFASVTKTQPASTAEFRKQFDIVLLDCGSLEASVDLLRHAAVADGVVIVIEAGRTTKEQIDRGTRVVDESRGKLIGFVLNKRRYPIPGWLYRLL